MKVLTKNYHWADFSIENGFYSISQQLFKPTPNKTFGALGAHPTASHPNASSILQIYLFYNIIKETASIDMMKWFPPSSTKLLTNLFSVD